MHLRSGGPKHVRADTAAEKGKRSDDRRGVLKHLPPSRLEGGKPPAGGRSEHALRRRGIGRRSSRTVNKTGSNAGIQPFMHLGGPIAA